MALKKKEMGLLQVLLSLSLSLPRARETPFPPPLLVPSWGAFGLAKLEDEFILLLTSCYLNFAVFPDRDGDQ